MLSRYINMDRIIHSLKTALACLMGFLLARLIGFQSDQWIIISIVVVMCAQLHVGSVLQKAYMRFLGTFLGCLIAAVTLITLGTQAIYLASAIALSGFLFSYLATGQESFTYASTLGAATTVIVLMNPNPTIKIAAERFLEISMGLFIATGVSQFILPIHARTYLRRTQAETLHQLRNYYQALIIDHAKEAESLKIQELDETIIKLLTKQRSLAKEAAREPLGAPFDPQHFMQSLQYEKEILRAISMMHHALYRSTIVSGLLTASPAFQTFNQATLQLFDVLIEALKTHDRTKEEIHLPSLDAIHQLIKENKSLLPQQDLTCIDGFLFALETLTSCLVQLAGLYQVLIKQEKEEL